MRFFQDGLAQGTVEPQGGKSGIDKPSGRGIERDRRKRAVSLRDVPEPHGKERRCEDQKEEK
jgi:hypothetical protein